MDQVESAQIIATIAHAGQTDKAGNPYADHPRRVAEHLINLTPGATEDMIAAAWLHDVLEDTSATAALLLECGISRGAVHIVELLSRRGEVSSMDYYAAIKDFEPARQVKLADIADNSDEARLMLLAPELADRLRAKYESAQQALGNPGIRSEKG